MFGVPRLKHYHITHEGARISYVIRPNMRSRRLRLSVYSNTQVCVSVPQRVSSAFVHAWVRGEAAWIFRVLRQLEKKCARFDVRGVVQPSFASSKARAKKKIVERVKFWNERYRFSYHTITIRDSGSRWGSCSKQKNLNFNYRLLFLPEELLDYVVVHELCHLRELNHSMDFWRLVANVLPEYGARRKDLGRYSSGEKL